MKLSAMPKAMGFEAAKGYFPHFFNLAENQNYIGPYPEPECYGVQSMMTKEKEEFFTWYDSVKHGVFNFKEEMAFYCKNDVEILRTACIKFRDEVIKIGNIDPFQCMTLASLCMAMYRQNCMPPKSVGIIPSDHYSSSQKNYSNASIQWLLYLCETEKLNIRHALNLGEVKKGSFYLDGYAVVKGIPTAFEFAGCFYHGCPECYDLNSTHPLTGMTCAVMYQKFMRKLEILRTKFNLDVRMLWEHSWETMKKQDLRLQTFLKHCNFPQRIQPRDSLFGGRTNAIKLYHKAVGPEQIHYYDFTSLYPFVNKTKTYPVGHPTIIFQQFGDLRQYFGLIKATVQPPRGLNFPVLPLRFCGKLMFTLCRTCAETEAQIVDCRHTEDERALTGTWCSVEITKAIDKGYKVSKVYEIWHYPQRTSELFSDYIKLHLKGKQEASGYPAWCTDEASRDRYILDYYHKEGVQLDHNNIAR
ncbi:uncharacterized protein LOC127527551 [Erpetoichthys calabaricus]|uniref:uncharacterized protein LOC127527551 n=1 Tax=Erpetoichthys calabaricus TaxID=27687 RepID=UPI002233F314|nr:uncharacterized protein LOC127527551 [Erpetoichthys calabaricus]